MSIEKNQRIVVTAKYLLSKNLKGEIIDTNSNYTNGLEVLLDGFETTILLFPHEIKLIKE